MVCGGAEETKALLKNRFDHILYTGTVLQAGSEPRQVPAGIKEKLLNLFYC